MKSAPPVVSADLRFDGPAVATAMLTAGRTDEARGLLERSAATAPRDADAWLGLAALHLTEGRQDQALAAYLRAASLRPPDQDLTEAVVHLSLSKPVPDIPTAAERTHLLEPPCRKVAELWQSIAGNFVRANEPESARAAAWEAQRLSGVDGRDETFADSRRLADVDLEPSSPATANMMAEQGYAVVPRVIAGSQLERFRSHSIANPIHSELDTGRVLTANMLDRIPELVDITLQPAVLAALRQWLGPRPLLAPLATAASGLFTGWHTDCAYMPGGGRTFSEGSSTLVLTMLIYLQDNRPFVGGGLDVMKGSHRQTSATLSGTARTIATRSGDALFFDSRIAHRASPRLLSGNNREPKVLYSLLWAADADYGRRFHAAYSMRSDLNVRTPDRVFLRTLQAKCDAVGVGVIE